MLCCSSQRSPSPGPNHVAPSSSSSSNAPNSASAPPNAAAARPACSFTPTLAAHFNENLIKHVQGWPAEHVEKQVGSLSLIGTFGFLSSRVAVETNSVFGVFHFEPRRPDYVRRPTPWGASACLRTAPSSRTCALWCESVKFKPRYASRGENMDQTTDTVCPGTCAVRSKC